MYPFIYTIVQLEWTYKDHLVQPSDLSRANQKLAYSWGHYSNAAWILTGTGHQQPPQEACLTTLTVKIFFLMFSLNLPWCSSLPFPHKLPRGSCYQIKHLFLLEANKVKSQKTEILQFCCFFLLSNKTDKNTFFQ